METIAYTFCAYLPIHLLAYLPFLDLLRFGKFWMAATVAGNMVLHLLGVAWMISLGRPDLVMAVGLAMVPLSLALYFLNIRLAPGKLLFTYMLLVNYQSMAQGISAFCAVRLFHADARSLESGLLCLALFALAWLPMHRLFRYAARQVYRIDAPRLWRVIWLLPAIMSGIVTVFTGDLGNGMAGSWLFLLTRTSLLLCVVVVYWVLLSALDGIQKQAVLQEQLNLEAHLLEAQISEQKKYNQLMVEHVAELRRQRHDLRHQLTAIRDLAGPDDSPLREYLDGLLDDIPAAPHVFCKNQAVNAVVSRCDGICRERGIDFTVRLNVPADTEQITDAELCVIFGNLLENAVEACGRMSEGRKFIRLNSAVHLGTLTITMDTALTGRCVRRTGSSAPASGTTSAWASAPFRRWPASAAARPGSSRTGGCSARRCTRGCDRPAVFSLLVSIHVQAFIALRRKEEGWLCRPTFACQETRLMCQA